MKKYNLTIFSGSGNINTHVIASHIKIENNGILFYKDSELISIFPLNITAINSIESHE